MICNNRDFNNGAFVNTYSILKAFINDNCINESIKCYEVLFKMWW